MRKIVIAVMSTISGLLMLFSYHTSTNSQAATTTTDTGSGSGTDPTASASTTPNSSAASGTYTGDAVSTQWGTVQVQVTAAEAVQYPSGNSRDQQINAYAVPQLNAEVVAAQSANIDAVSGATVTSGGYITSLQSAIDQANI